MSELRAAAERVHKYADNARREGKSLDPTMQDADMLARAVLNQELKPASVEIESTDQNFWRQFMSFIQFTQVEPNTTTIRLKN